MTGVVEANNPWHVAVLAGMASYLDAGALITSGVAIGTLYATQFDLAAGVIGVLLGSQTLCVGAGALLGGWLGDRYGRRRVFTASLALFALSVAALMLATGPSLLWVGVVTTGLAIGADLPVSLAMINEEAPQGRKGRLVAFSELLWGAGIVVASLLTAVLASSGALGARIAFGHLLVVALVVLGLRLRMRESVEWTAAQRAAQQRDVGASDVVRFTRVGQLLRPPVGPAVLATGLYYAAWGVGANTIAQFGPFLWVELAGGEVAQWGVVSLVGFPLAVAGGLVFLRVVDTPARGRWVLLGSVMLVLAWVLPVVLGPTRAALVGASLLVVASTGLAGETVYKVWSQELMPTLLRSTAQGATLAVNRVTAAAFAVVTPGLAAAHPRALFLIVFALAVLAAVIALMWVPRLATARQLEEPTVVVKATP